MKHRCTVLLVLLLAQGPGAAEALAQEVDTTVVQDVRQDEPRGVVLEQNYPNPFRDETRIPFILGEDLFEEGRPVVVTVHIYNLLRQLVAIPIAIDHPTAAGQPAQEISYEAPGRYELYWDGTDRSGQPVSSGIYFCQIVANRSRDVRKMVVTR